jgi:hypothetical protein
MVTIISLWLAILLSAVFVWIVNAIIWMFLPHHKSDYKGFPDEEAVRNALLPQDLSPGQYDMPHIASRDELNKPEVKKKFEEGPAGFFTIVPKGLPPMSKGMILSFIYYLVVGIIVAYVATRTLSPGAEYLLVFRITATVAWLAYGFGIIQDAIWFGRPWSAIFKHLIDTVVLGLVTGGTFGWLWPN